MSKLKQWQFYLSALMALFSPTPAAPRTPDRKDQPAAPVEQREFEHEVDLDENYEQEMFYRGLPIFNKKGERDHLRSGREYVDGSWELPGGNMIMIYIDAAAPSKHIKGELGKTIFKKPAFETRED